MKYTKYLKNSTKGKVSLVFWLIVVALTIVTLVQAKLYLSTEVLLIGIVAAVILILFTWLFHYKLPRFSVVLSLLLIVALVFSNFTLAKVNSVTNSVTKDSTKQYETVYIACLKKSDISTEDDFSKYKLGYVLTDDTAYKRSSDLLNENNQTVKKSKPFKTAKAVYKSMKNEKTQLIYLTPSVLADFDDDDLDYEKTFKILYSKKYELEDIQTKAVDVTKEPYTIYIQGVDASSGNTSSSSTGGNITSTGRGDCNMLLTINPVTNETNIQVVPRDLKVYIPNKDVYSKLSYSAWWGGVQASIASLEDYFGIDINYYAKINFAGLTTVIDELGGVSVWSDYEFDMTMAYGNNSDNQYVKHISQGYNQVTGEEGLAFARERHSLPENAQSRSLNHIALLRAIFHKFAENPSYNEAMDILDSISTNFTTNIPKEDFKDMFGTLVAVMPAIINSDITTNSIEGDIEWGTDPVTGVYKRYFIPSKGEKKKVIERIDAVIQSSNGVETEN